MPGDFQSCIKNGAYDTVTPGEVCTLDIAQRLGVHDAATYFKSTAGYDEVKTYNDVVDKKGEDKTKSLCSYTSNATKDYKSCSLEHGVGFVRRISDKSKCMTFECPTGFESNGMHCKKPLEDYVISKVSHCDERWYDWFMTPNYHLGNKYYSPKTGQCYKPCPAYSVPQYAQDPVDDGRAGLNIEERLDRCVARNEYMSGKYANGSDFCPIAWVYRLSSTPDVMRQSILTELEKSKEEYGKDNMNTKYTELENDANSTSETSTPYTLSQQSQYILESLTVPTETMAQACRTLHTKDRLTYAYNACSNLSEDDTQYADQLATTLNDSPAVVATKINMYKQSCNALFCNSTDRVNEEIGQPEICMKVSGSTDIPTEDGEQERETPYTTAATGYVTTSMSVGMSLMISIIFIVLFVIFLKFILWPYMLRPIVAVLHNIIAGIFYNYYIPWHPFATPEEIAYNNAKKTISKFNKIQAKLEKSSA